MYIKMRYERVLVISDEYLRHRELTESSFKKSTVSCLFMIACGVVRRVRRQNENMIPDTSFHQV